MISREQNKRDISGKRAGKRAPDIYLRLFAVYGVRHCTLDYREPHELMIATIMSAQCTDRRVNAVTGELFRKYPDIRSFAEADQTVLEEDIRTVGFFRQKAASIIGACRMIMEKYGGEVPATMEGLTSLPGIGRKTANVILGDAFGVPGFPVDTHVRRVLNRLGVVDSDDPRKIELLINGLIAPEALVNFSHLLILHGRETCTARRARCAECMLLPLCVFGRKKMKKKSSVQIKDGSV